MSSPTAQDCVQNIPILDLGVTVLQCTEQGIRSHGSEMGLAAAVMIPYLEPFISSEAEQNGYWFSCVHGFLLHCGHLFALCCCQFCSNLEDGKRTPLEGAWACRLPEEDATGPSRHVQIRTMQDMCSGWLILHKVNTSLMLCTTSHHSYNIRASARRVSRMLLLMPGSQHSPAFDKHCSKICPAITVNHVLLHVLQEQPAASNTQVLMTCSLVCCSLICPIVSRAALSYTG